MNRRTVVLGTASVFLVPSMARAADTVTGRFVAQKKEAKLGFVSAYDLGGDKLIIVATEKSHAASKTLVRDAQFGDFGSAVTIALTKPSGAVSVVELANPGFPQNPVTINGGIKGSDVKFTGDRVEGRFSSGGAKSMFEGKPYEVTFELDLLVSAQIRAKIA